MPVLPLVHASASWSSCQCFLLQMLMEDGGGGNSSSGAHRSTSTTTTTGGRHTETHTRTHTHTHTHTHTAYCADRNNALIKTPRMDKHISPKTHTQPEST